MKPILVMIATVYVTSALLLGLALLFVPDAHEVLMNVLLGDPNAEDRC